MPLIFYILGVLGLVAAVLLMVVADALGGIAAALGALGYIAIGAVLDQLDNLRTELKAANDLTRETHRQHLERLRDLIHATEQAGRHTAVAVVKGQGA